MRTSSKDNLFIPASEKIERALVELIRKKPYKSISVSEIAQTAGISRQAFYLNFPDKDEVLESIFKRLFTDIMNTVGLPEIDTVRSLVEAYTDIAEENSDFLTVLAENKLGPVLSRVFIDELIKRSPVLNSQKEPENETERLYINSFWVTAFAEVYSIWLRNGMSTPKEELNAILADIMTGKYFTK